ncbi:hypothetical protein BDQ17DRAFT_881029 [Cyathus striatus]|nr:hypothetical protein BDQ17DRAFT_881029 [Cyathus striatus]
MNTDDPNWTANSANGGRSPRDAPRRNSRSRSPGRDDRGGRDGKEGGGTNPGNNLHVSGLSHKIDTRELEATLRRLVGSKRLQSCTTPTPGVSRLRVRDDGDVRGSGCCHYRLNTTEIMGKVLPLKRPPRTRQDTHTRPILRPSQEG